MLCAQVIRLVFEDFEVGDEPDEVGVCGSEGLEVRDDGTYGPVLVLLCGSRTPDVVVSNTNKLLLTLKTPVYDNNKRGFKIVYDFETGSRQLQTYTGDR